MSLPWLTRSQRKRESDVASPIGTDEQFIACWKKHQGRLDPIAQELGFSSVRAVSNRRQSLEQKLGITLHSYAANSSRNSMTRRQNSRRLEVKLANGRILVGSDIHIWGRELTTAQRAFIALAKKLQPEYIVLNGDVFDGAKISNHPAGIWDQEDRPDVQTEIEACQAFCGELQKAAPRAKLIWVWGNHDMRYEYQLAARNPQYKGVRGFHLGDHFPEWQFCMAVFVNDDLVIKHRFKGGRHAPENNALWAGRSMVTGHLHSQKVQPVTDYNETRYGVDSGTMADPESKQFDYTEENPTGWRSGFALLSFVEGHLLMPELVKVCDWNEDAVEFRGELIPV